MMNMLSGIPIGANIHDFIEEFSAVDSPSGVEKLAIPQKSSRSFCMIDDDSSKRVDAQDLSATDAVAAVFQSFSIDRSSIVRDEEVKDTMKVDYSAESSLPKNDKREDALNVNKCSESSSIRDEGKALTKVVDIYSTTCPDIAYTSPCQRSSHHNKLDQEIKKKTPARSCRKGASKKAMLDVSYLQFTRRRRSSLCKQARATVWGLLVNVAPVLEQNGPLDTSPQKAKKSRRLKGDEGKAKREKNKRVQNSTKLQGKRFTPSGPICLKVKFGKETACLMNVRSVIDDNKVEDSKVEKSSSEVSKDVRDLLNKEVTGSMSFQSCNENLEKASDMHLAVEGITEIADRNTYDDLCESPSHGEVDKVVVASDTRISDSGTSPDSEVINLTPDEQTNEEDSESLHHALNSANMYLGSENISSLHRPFKNADKGKRGNQHHQASDFSTNGEVPSPANKVDVQEFSKLGQREKVGDVCYYSDASTSTTTENGSLNILYVEGFTKEPSPCTNVTNLAISCLVSKVESGAKANLSPRPGIQLELMESTISDKLLPCTKGQKLAKSSRTRKETKSCLKTPNSSKRREETSKKKGNQGESSGKQKNKNEGDFAQILHEVETHRETGTSNKVTFELHALAGFEEAGETGSGNKSLTGDTPRKSMTPVGVVQQCIPLSQAWVCCEDCQKWRRIPAALADQIEETRCSWVCKDNMDKDYADCLIPQEKSDADINAELDISDEEDTCDVHLNSIQSIPKQPKVTQQPSWMLIKSNLFLHRRRKTQAIDEIMVCHCKPPSEGQVGCGDGCLNRMLNIECIQGTCPCGEFCSNQQFQKRKYANLKSIKCGKKGYGLQLLEDVSEGQFLIEYVGEVLDMHTYEARQKDYAVKGHKHFYFMTLNGSEVIDACAKGNLGRFINHSCDPNCRTEKWIVNGEVCIGIFAFRDIKKGEEVTFDYNYVRVFGAAAKKCVCGSSQCQGYIGGDRLNAEVIVQAESDEEFPEPVVVSRNGEVTWNLNNATSATSSLIEKEIVTVREPSRVEDHINGSASISGKIDMSSEKQTGVISYQDKIGIDGSTTLAECLEITKESGDLSRSASTALSIAISLETESSVEQHSSVRLVGTSSQSRDITSENMSAARENCSATESMGNPLCSNQGSDANPLYGICDKIDSEKKVKSNVGEVRVVLSKSHARTKTSKRSSSVKRKPKTHSVDIKKPLDIDNKEHVPPFKPKKLLEDLSNGHFEAVQEKLNELLDNGGGISKRKDATRGYLKLLLLTAASGDSGNGEAIQSNRDLSMILDALLKTKSRTVLVDIINKNGLQMLHNIMKRCRKEFIKIPILRKLLKVLEYLATREILTSEHINGGPRCPGVESFRDSILTLTEHTDKQVHQIARNFRDRWIQRCFRKFGGRDRDDCPMEIHRGSNHDRLSASHANSSDCTGIPSETHDCIAKPVLVSSSVDGEMPDVSSVSRGTRKRKSRWDQPSQPSHGSPHLGAKTHMASSGAKNEDEDAPPGFSFPQTCPMLPSDAYVNDTNHKKGRTDHANHPYGVAMGQSLPRFSSRLSVAYGVPISIVQQFGTYQGETLENWIIAPGMPFQPFPPLPPYPRDKIKHATTSQGVQKAELESQNISTLNSSQNSTSEATAVGMETLGAINHPHFRRVRSPHNLSRKYFRQQKWNSSTAGAPWVQKKNGWGSVGNNSRNGMCQASLGNGYNEFSSSYSLKDISTNMQSGVERHQHP
ncbi:hypothetical protein ACH5RR_034127 [Cinchona calisaya]|uniref:Histone-lysine N-methyltransferase ASHH2 n=1 Tax=Cinchona calisaya TaxID=153742 RepID=A0ABD2YB98_9GENT